MGARGRSGARRLLLQALYQAQISGHDRAVLEQQFAENPGYAAADSDYFLHLLEKIESNRDELDAELTRYGDIRVELLDPVEHAVLWIALAEFLYQADVPRKVVLNEAIELAKLFGAEGGHKYVNGVLDKIANKLPST